MEKLKEAVMKNPFYVIKIFFVVVFVFGMIMILHQKILEEQSARSSAEAEQIAGLWKAGENFSAEGKPAAEPELPEEESEPPEEAEEPLPEEAAALADIRLEALREVNKDVIGWIEIPGTEVSYPLLKGEDNQYYLSHDWQKEENNAGSIFLESQCSPDLTGFHTIVYGHRMRNETMFGSLKYYKDPKYWREHPSVYLVVDSGIYRYDIFSAWEAGLKDIVYYLDLTDREEEFIRTCLENSVITTGIVPDVQDKILTMSTCTGNGHSKRWTIQGYLAQVYTVYSSENETGIKKFALQASFSHDKL